MTDILIVVIILGLANGVIAQIVTHSALFEEAREVLVERFGHWAEVVECHLCFGTWSAMGISFLATWRLTDWEGVDGALAFFAGAFAIHGVGLITGYTYRALVAVTDKLEG